MENQILAQLFKLEQQNKEFPNSWQISKEFKQDHANVIGALNSLEAKEYLKLTNKKEDKFLLTEEGKPDNLLRQ